MNKNKKIVLVSIATISTFPVLAISANGCDNNKKNLIEFNQLVKTFPINIDVNKYTIDEALDIKKYEISFDLKGKFQPEFKLKSLIKNEDNVVLTYYFYSNKYKFNSEILTKTFTNFKKAQENPDPTPNPTPGDEPEKNYQEVLDKEAQQLKVSIESDKYTIDEALKLENYKYTLNQALTFELVKLAKKSELEVEMQFKLQWKEKQLTSKVITKTFKDFKTLPIAEWTSEAGISNGVSFSKFAKLGNFINVKSSQSLDENLKLIRDFSNTEVTLTETKIVSYDELEGKIVFETNIKTSSKDFGKQEIELSNIKTPNIFNDNFIVAPEIDKEKLIKAKKQFKEIDSKEAKDYLKLYAYDKNNNKIDLFELLKTNQSYSFSRELAITGNEHNIASFALALKYKKLEKNGHQVQELSKTFDKVNIKIANSIYTYVDVLNYIIDTAVVQKNDLNIKDTYASSYLHTFRNTKKIIHNFYENKEENYYNENESKIQFSNETQTTNDIEGSIIITFSLSLERNGQTYHSKPKEVKIEGFKKVDATTFSTFQLLFEYAKPSTKKFAEKVKKEYEKDNNFILDKSWIEKNLQNATEFVILRTVDEGKETQRLDIRNHSTLTLNAGGRPIKDCIKPNYQSQIEIYDNDPKFEIEAVIFDLQKVKVSSVQDSKVFFEIKYKLIITTVSNQNIELEKTLTHSFNK